MRHSWNAHECTIRGEWEKLGAVVQANQVVAVLIMTAAFFLLNRVCFLLFGFMKVRGGVFVWGLGSRTPIRDACGF